MTLALVLTVPAGEAELASDALWALGVLAIEERGDESGTEDRLVELWTSLGDDIGSITTAAEAFPARWRWWLAEVDDSVADTWRAHATATWVADDLVVVPAWMPFDAPAGVLAVPIEPGAAFGLGNHPTTVATLRAMRVALFDGAVVLDVGCGSGVLGIVACLLGAARVEAIDISPAAIEATRDNARRNAVDGRLHAGTTPIAAVDGPFDLIVANVLAPALIDMAADLRRLLAPAGVLVVSGLLADRFEHVTAALQPLQVIDVDRFEGWAAISLRA